jgi:hypothetical protein
VQCSRVKKKMTCVLVPACTRAVVLIADRVAGSRGGAFSCVHVRPVPVSVRKRNYIDSYRRAVPVP